MKKLKIRIGKNSWGHFRMGSYISMIAIFAALGVGKVAEWLGTPDAGWVGVVEWVALTIFTGDIFRALMHLSPRKRWERVMMLGVIVGLALLLGALAIYRSKGYVGIVPQMILVGGFSLVVMGLGGFICWRMELKKLNSHILARQLKRKRNIL